MKGRYVKYPEYERTHPQQAEQRKSICGAKSIVGLTEFSFKDRPRTTFENADKRHAVFIDCYAVSYWMPLKRLLFDLPDLCINEAFNEHWLEDEAPRADPAEGVQAWPHSDTRCETRALSRHGAQRSVKV
ncbi:uncharacterized protein H6S33_006457 [Morchella sextelata]|uniref:uncharacterized protein n=1 Tax=Morchella sextelata TaxID=1174677 RepID=UPI001D0515B6|nr:uncharacterized protein H6S33_006457 [Morchella sextelata]KAH0604789.1 hypothetical protein H6S33_006457 [Morchella sextelata]